MTSTLLTAPLSLGTGLFYMKSTDATPLPEGQKRSGAKEVFSWYVGSHRWLRAIALKLLVWIKSLFWVVLFTGAPFALSYVQEKKINVPEVTDISALSSMSTAQLSEIAISRVGLIVAFVLIIFAALRIMAYLPATYLLAQNPELSAAEALKRSVQITKGHLWELLIFHLSYIIWAMLSLVTYGIAMLYLIPYYSMSMALFVRYLSAGPDKEGIFAFPQPRVDGPSI